jgi:hypothetical protein
MMCKPSKHLIEYIENQNLDIETIIKDLPDNLPLVEQKEEKNEVASTPVVPDPNLPGAKEEVIEEKKPGAEVGIVESVPVVESNGNVQLNTPVVTPSAVPDIPAATPLPQSTTEKEPVAVPTMPQPPIGNQPFVQTTTQLPQATTNQQVAVAPVATPAAPTQQAVAPVVAPAGQTQQAVVPVVTTVPKL